MIQPIPSGVNPDTSGFMGLLAMWQNLNAYVIRAPQTVSSGSSTAFTLPAANIAASGYINRTGTPGGGVTETTDTAVNIIAALPNTIPIGRYSKPLRISNSTGQTITLSGGTGVTVSGNNTIANGSWRDFIVQTPSATTVTFTNIGTGSL